MKVVIEGSVFKLIGDDTTDWRAEEVWVAEWKAENACRYRAKLVQAPPPPPKPKRIITKPNLWLALVPERVAERQARWERWRDVLRMRRTTSLTLEKIGDRIGVGRERVRQIIARAEQHEEWSIKHRGRWLSPVEWYFADDRADLKALVQ